MKGDRGWERERERDIERGWREIEGEKESERERIFYSVWVTFWKYLVMVVKLIGKKWKLNQWFTLRLTIFTSDINISIMQFSPMEYLSMSSQGITSKKTAKTKHYVMENTFIIQEWINNLVPDAVISWISIWIFFSFRWFLEVIKGETLN